MLILGDQSSTKKCYMKYLNLIIILIVSSILLSGCAFQYQVDDLQTRVIYLESQLDTSELDNLEKLLNTLVQEVTDLKGLEEVKDLSEIKSQLEAFHVLLKLHESDLDELKDFSERVKTGLVMMAGEIDKHAEAIEGLAGNDDNIKTILEIAKDIIDAINERQKILEGQIKEIQDKSRTVK